MTCISASAFIWVHLSSQRQRACLGNLQKLANFSVTRGFERPRHMKADPVLPRSASIGAVLAALRRPHVGSVMIGYIKAVIFFEGLTATSGRNLAPIRPHSPPHRLATITDGVAGWLPGPTAASRRPARRRAVSRRSVEAPHELPQYHLHVDGRDRGHHQEIHGGAREALHEAMVGCVATSASGGW